MLNESIVRHLLFIRFPSLLARRLGQCSRQRVISQVGKGFADSANRRLTKKEWQKLKTNGSNFPVLLVILVVGTECVPPHVKKNPSSISISQAGRVWHSLLRWRGVSLAKPICSSHVCHCRLPHCRPHSLKAQAVFSNWWLYSTLPGISEKIFCPLQSSL